MGEFIYNQEKVSNVLNTLTEASKKFNSLNTNEQLLSGVKQVEKANGYQDCIGNINISAITSKVGESEATIKNLISFIDTSISEMKKFANDKNNSDNDIYIDNNSSENNTLYVDKNGDENNSLYIDNNGQERMANIENNSTKTLPISYKNPSLNSNKTEKSNVGGYSASTGFIGDYKNQQSLTKENPLDEIVARESQVASATPKDSVIQTNIAPILAGIGAATIASITAKKVLDNQDADKKQEADEIKTENWEEVSSTVNTQPSQDKKKVKDIYDEEDDKYDMPTFNKPQEKYTARSSEELKDLR